MKAILGPSQLQNQVASAALNPGPQTPNWMAGVPALDALPLLLPGPQPRHNPRLSRPDRRNHSLFDVEQPSQRDQVIEVRALAGQQNIQRALHPFLWVLALGTLH